MDPPASHQRYVMSTAVRLVLLMAIRVYEFVVAFPEANPGFIQAVELLKDRLDRAEELAGLERSGRVSARVAKDQRKALVAELRATPLRLLAEVARAAFKDQPEVMRRFRVPSKGVGKTTFITAVRATLAEAEAARDILLQHGLPETLLAELTVAVGRYDGLITEANAGLREHVGAHADLEAVAQEILGIVRHLDALSTYRFRENPERLAAWKSARNVAWAHKGQEEPAAVPPPVPAPAPAPTVQ